MSRIILNYEENSLEMTSPKHELDAAIAYLDTGKPFKTRDLHLQLSPSTASMIISDMNCVEKVGKEGKANVYVRTFDPHDKAEKENYPLCRSCHHDFAAIGCAIVGELKYSRRK